VRIDREFPNDQKFVRLGVSTIGDASQSASMEFTTMPATVKLQLSFSSLVEAISSLDLTEKQQLQDIIEQQLFEAEEDTLEQDPQTLAEIAEARQAYQNGDYQTIQEYIASRAEHNL
jgi:hypothetical protein